MFLGTIVNCFAIIAGGGLGLLIKKGLKESLATALMNAVGLCVLMIGVSGMLEGQNLLITILSLVFGTLIGEGLDLDGKIHRLGHKVEAKVQTKPSETSVSQGFVTASLLFCVGAMAIVGSLQSGLTGNHETLFAKSLLDAISAIVFSSSMGIGVLLSAGMVLVYQGSITFLANVLAPLLTDVIIAEMTAVGSLLIIGLALNVLKVTDLKIMNFAPAVLFPILLSFFM